MQHNPNRDVLVGAVGVAVLAGLFAFSYAGKDLSSKANVGTYPVAATFDRIDGLVAGDEVRLGGIRVGTVGMPTLDASYRAVVTLNIQNEIRIPVDSAAAIHTDGLFGSKFVVLEPGVEEDYLKSGSVITYTQPAMIVSELLGMIIDEGHARLAEQKAASGADAPTQGDN
ncbi:MAG: MCE family protein [Alphaproteobacteria bacterium]|nr:MCE family protein [Alphaproteobacteria bacterium]